MVDSVTSKIHSPDKIFAVAAERRLFEKPCHELMVLYFMNIFLSQRSASLDPTGDRGSSVSISTPTLVVGHVWCEALAA